MVAALRFLSITAGSVLLLTQLVSAGFPDDPSVVTYWGQVNLFLLPRSC